MFNSRFGVGVLKHPGYNIGGGVGEGLLLESVLTGAVVGGGISALTGGNFLEGALTGGIGGGIKSFLPDFTKIFSSAGAPAVGAAEAVKAPLSAGAQAFTPGTAIPTSPFGTTSLVSATSPFGTVGGGGIANLAANAYPGVSPSIIQAAQNQVAANAGNIPATTQGATVPQPPTGAQTDYAKIIQDKKLQPYGLSDAASGTITKSGDYVLDGKVYKGADILKATQPQSFFDKYKMPILIGGAGLAYNMLNEKPTMATVPTQRTGALTGKYNLAPNYVPLPNPVSVYPRFAEGGIAQLADGGRMGVDKVNVDFMGGDMYPMSQQNRSFYATPSQMPTSAQQTMASYEPRTNPLTGQATAHMASGGTATSGQVYYDADKGQYYTIKDSPQVLGPFGIVGAMAPGFGMFSNFGQNTSNRNYIGSSLGNSGISSEFQPSIATPNVYESTYADVPTAPPAASTVSYPTYSLADSADLLRQTNPGLIDKDVAKRASGGIADLGSYSDGGRMLKGPGDGMSDSIPGMIANKRPARLAEGEFVVPADVVSHLGNGSTDAGAKQLYAMMDKVRQARTGNKKQGKQINPRKLMPA